MSDLPEEVNTQLRSILTTLRQRTERVKTLVQQPPTPAELSEEEEEEEETIRHLILEDFTESRYASKQSLPNVQGGEESWRSRLRISGYIDPRGGLNIGTNCPLHSSPEYYS